MVVVDLSAWMDEASLTVVNRLGSHQLNGYKPAHYAWLSAHGLLVPPSLLSADPRWVREFIGAGRAVVKPVCAGPGPRPRRSAMR